LLIIIFCIGPLNVFFKIREGKTSLEKIREDYEEERRGTLSALAKSRGENPNRGLLPTTTRPTQRQRAQTNVDEAEMN
jgi:hypothetical protein